LTKQRGDRSARALPVAGSVLLAVLAACSGSDTESDEARADAASGGSSSHLPAARPNTGNPDTHPELTHSPPNRDHTHPNQGTDTTTNSWATGTNPAVDSIYLRILEKNPRIEGHAANYGSPSATIADIKKQALSAVAQDPPPDLVLVQAIDADIVCPAEQSDYDAFGEGLREVLDVFAQEAPATRVFVVTQFGTPSTYTAAITPAQRKAFGGTGPCAFLDPQGKVVPAEMERLEEIIDGYEAQIPLVCDTYERCSHDHGAMSRAVENPGDFGDDAEHFSIQGHARVASIVWKALRREGLMPAA
jgi:lysophospholipase L1-like esterase